MQKTLSAVFVAAAITASVASAARAQPSPTDARSVIADALAADSKGDAVTAVELLQPLAASGDPFAQTLLGFHYVQGNGVDIDDAKAQQFFDAGSAAGIPLASVGLGELFQFGFGVPRDYDMALMYLHTAADAGLHVQKQIAALEKEHAEDAKKPPLSCVSQGFRPVGTPPDRMSIDNLSFIPPAGEDWCIDPAASSRLRALIRYDLLAHRRPETISMPQEAHTFYILVQEVAVDAAMPATPEDLMTVAQTWAAADAGWREGPQFDTLALKPLHSRDGNRFRVVRWSANPATDFGLDCVLVSVEMEERDNKLFPGLQTLLVDYYLCLNPGSEKRLISIAASERYMQHRNYGLNLMKLAEIQPFLASLRLQVPAGDAKAMRRLTEAAERGRAQAQFALATALNAAGQYDEAAAWFRRAADQHHCDAEYYVGSFYDSGTAVIADAGEALRWYRRAADDGCALGHVGIALHYANATAADRDPALALLHFNIAAARLDDAESRQQAADKAKELKASLDLAAIDLAADRASRWRAGDP